MPSSVDFKIRQPRGTARQPSPLLHAAMHPYGWQAVVEQILRDTETLKRTDVTE